MNNLRQADLKDKKVLLRVDFDVPVSDEGQIEESFRIKKQKETIDYLVIHGAKVIMVAHISAQSVGRSFASLIPQLHMLLGYEISFLKTIPEIGVYLENYAGPALLDNIRQNAGEKENDLEFAKQLATGFDIYVNNDFAVCHRNHASVSAIADLLPNYAGFVVEEEIARLSEVINSPKEGKVIVIGGAKAESKIPVIKNFIDPAPSFSDDRHSKKGRAWGGASKADKRLIGGVIANDILKAKGQDVGDSIVDENASELLAGLDLNNPQLVMPKDFNISDKKILDIGPKAIKEFSEIIKNSKMIIWNGPMGMFEKLEFAHGTKAVAEALIASKASKIIGGGDTISAVDGFGLLGKFSAEGGSASGGDFVSTGGGAMLAFLAGVELPGLKALEYYDNK